MPAIPLPTHEIYARDNSARRDELEGSSAILLIDTILPRADAATTASVSSASAGISSFATPVRSACVACLRASVKTLGNAQSDWLERTVKCAFESFTPASSEAGIDTATGAAFQLPGRTLQVLFVGPIVFSAITLLGIIAVVIMTYERIKHRKRFRADHSAEVQLWTEIAKEQQEAEAGGGPPLARRDRALSRQFDSVLPLPEVVAKEMAEKLPVAAAHLRPSGERRVWMAV